MVQSRCPEATGKQLVVIEAETAVARHIFEISAQGISEDHRQDSKWRVRAPAEATLREEVRHMVPDLHPGDAPPRPVSRASDLEQLPLREGSGNQQARSAREAAERMAYRSSPRASDRQR